ncbi:MULTISPECIES: diguanylate cyclase domain-containing protein [unclassified Fusibacter]|uniref:sensor domain-containing diguanylate cyclase/phosphohydrolase n=1 Tax=unclassified Fusibacter TaxID=2624464 RepID=UPI001010E921|nr:MULTISPECIES: HD domain-containing phosphohydrolase [unclassified Fusibacter]MCK8058249.1 diguanylate cyclase [Fusibacter sp. A2]NPE20832.1 diguanylate cyclase [Fusibacter sp. A1]RXV63036.1 diguanylate cyclase [Fusibacter sp. A1]
MDERIRKQLISQLNELENTLKTCGNTDVIKACGRLIEVINDQDESNLSGELTSSFIYDVLHNANVVVFEWTLTPDSPTKYVTENISQFGYMPEDFYTGKFKDYWEFIHPEDRGIAKSNVDTARQLGLNEFRHIYRIKTSSGQSRWVEERLVIERDSYGNLLAEKGVLFDITERKLLELKLEQSKIRYQRLYENAGVMMFTFDKNGSIVSANRKCVEILGESRARLLNRKISSLLSPAQQKRNQAIDMLDFAQRNLDKEFELDVIHASGKLLTLNIKLNPILHEGEIVEFEGIGHDITQKKVKERQLTYLTYHDKLTGLFNRAYFDEKLGQLNRAGAYPFSIIVGDMNGLKDVNDLLGHDSGDQLLIDMAKILKNACRETDIIARYGGDEFLVLIPHGDEVVADRIIKSIESQTKDSQKSMLKPSIALGAATIHDESLSVEQLIQLADDAMYAQKACCLQSSRSKLNENLSVAIDKLPKSSREKSERLRKLAYPLGISLGMDPILLERLNLAVTLHDLGQIGLPHSILVKKGKFEESEYELMKKHTEIGYRILSKYHVDDHLLNTVRYHHEWYDGSGYPVGLKGEQIPLCARIIAVLEAYDAMIRSRSYRKKRSPKEAVEELLRHAGTQFDKCVVKSLEQMVIGGIKLEEGQGNKIIQRI